MLSSFSTLIFFSCIVLSCFPHLSYRYKREVHHYFMGEIDRGNDGYRP